MFEIEDREVQYPNRVQLVPVPGTTDQFDIIPVPGVITKVGTALNKELFDSIKEDIINQHVYHVPNAEWDEINNVAVLKLNKIINEYRSNNVLHIKNNTPTILYSKRNTQTILAKKYSGSSSTAEGSDVSVDFFNTDVTSTSSSNYLGSFNGGKEISWVYFKLEKPIMAKNIILRYYSGSNSTYKKYYSKNYKISGSNDGITWTEIYSGTEGSSDEFIINLPDNNAYYQYYRMDMLNANDTVWLYGIRISEYYMQMDEIDEPLLLIGDLEEKAINGTLKDGYLYDLIYNGVSWDVNFCINELDTRLINIENAIVALGGSV